jgi:hypothetical protein
MYHAERGKEKGDLRRKRRRVVKENEEILCEIELNDASERSRTGSLAFGVDLRYGAAKNSTGRIIYGKTSSAISGHPDVPCFLLLDHSANELLLPVRLSAGRILTR